VGEGEEDSGRQSDVVSDVRRREGQSSMVDVGLVNAALKMHRAPVHALRDGKAA
jgi:hypothetical protein